MAHRGPVFHRLAVAEVRPETDDSVVIGFDVPPGLADEYRFEAGQHVTVRAEIDGEDVRRSYSICSPVGGTLRIGVRRDPNGTMSRWLHDEVAPRDELDVMTPIGSFTGRPEPDQRRHHVAVAAGSGITPVLSIVSTLLAGEPESEVTLLYVNRSQSSIMFVEDLEALKNRHLARLRTTHLFTREQGASDLLSGRPGPERMSRLVDAGVLPVDADSWFVCGPKALTDTVLAELDRRGVDRRRVHTELFATPGLTRRAAPPATEPEEAVATCTVVLNGRTTTLALGEGDTVLDAARRHRTDVPYSCTVGACSTCRAKVIDGEVAMDVCYGLEPDEVAAGYVLTCQSRPVTDQLTVDYDA